LQRECFAPPILKLPPVSTVSLIRKGVGKYELPFGKLGEVLKKISYIAQAKPKGAD
jgi:hypothetical protein